MNTDTFPGAIRTRAQLVRDVVGNGCWHRESAPCSLGLCWMGMRHGMCLWGLGSRELGPPAVNLDSHFSRVSQGQGSVGQTCCGMVASVGRLLPESGTLLGRCGTWNVLPCARVFGTRPSSFFFFFFFCQ